MKDSKKRSLIKAIIYRLFAIKLSIILAYLWFREPVGSIGFGITYSVIAIIGYYVHERMWERIRYGKIMEVSPKISVKDKRKPLYLGTKIRAYIDLMRPFTMIGAGLAGFFVVLLASFFWHLNTALFPLALTAGLILALLQAGGQSMNQSLKEEVEIDKINRKSYRPVVRGLITPKQGKIFSMILYIIAILWAFLVQTRFGVFATIIAFFAIFYTMPPIRAKKRFLINNLWQGISRGFLPVVACWSLVSTPFHPLPITLGVVIATWITGAQATKDIVDVKGDKKFGIKTLFVVYPKGKAINVISFFMSLSFIILMMAMMANIIPSIFVFMFILGIPSAYIVKEMKRTKMLKHLENTLSWGLFYGTLSLFYILPTIIVCLPL